MEGHKKSYIQRLRAWYFPFLIGLLFGIGIQWTLGARDQKPAEEKREGEYEFVNPLLECEGAEELISREIRTFKGSIADLINKRIEEGRIKYASVYFRDLNNGPWFGINEHEVFEPGSLLKIPIMMGYLKEAETDPGILKKEIRFDRKLPSNIQYIKPTAYMEFGRSYTIEDLIYRMIVHSDNDAAYLLILHDNGKVYNKVFGDLNLSVPPYIGPYKISVKRYASFFRVLFNASYLNKDMSNLALKILSNADFRGGLVAGTPSSVPVAQKFGELSSNEFNQLHDCGIVYYPGYPYLLCIMTRGDSFEDLSSFVKEVSAMFYEEVDRQFKEGFGAEVGEP